MKKILYPSVAIALLFLAGCGLFRRVPHSTFSLNGGWTMLSTSDNDALLGSTITVNPLDADGYAMVNKLSNNAYCVRPNDIIWKDITSTGEGFSLNNLCNSCVSSLEYRPANIFILTKDSIKLAGSTKAGRELVQIWKRNIDSASLKPVRKR